MHVMHLGQHELTVAAPASAKPEEARASVRLRRQSIARGSSSFLAFGSRARLCLQEQSTTSTTPRRTRGERNIDRDPKSLSVRRGMMSCPSFARCQVSLLQHTLLECVLLSGHTEVTGMEVSAFTC